MPLFKDDYVKTEKMNGVIYNMSPSGGFNHATINGNIDHIIKSSLKDSICMVFMENLDLYLSEDEYVIPDVMVICDRNHITAKGYKGTPRFIAETLSPSTAFKDRTVKKEKYAQIGVEEYWIIDPRSKAIEIYHLKEKEYILENSLMYVEDAEDESYNAETELSLYAFPNIKMRLEEIFRNTL